MLKLSLLLFLLSSLLFAQRVELDTISKSASLENKTLFVYLHRVGCSYCNSMQEFTLEDDSVAEYINENFILVSINITDDDTIIYKGKQSSGVDFAKAIGYNFYPSSLFFSKDMKLLYGAAGYKNEIEFMTILEYMHEGAFKRMSLDEYKKSIDYQDDMLNQIEDRREHVR